MCLIQNKKKKKIQERKRKRGLLFINHLPGEESPSPWLQASARNVDSPPGFSSALAQPQERAAQMPKLFTAN